MKLNTGLLLIGCASVGSHLVILVAMFLANGRRFVSEYMMDIIWYCATITMLFLIEHAVWLYVLWVVSRPPFLWRLGVAYFGVLVACVSWVMEVVVPMVPNVGKLHSIFCMIFIVGCLINLVASVLLVLPGKVQGVVLLLPPARGDYKGLMMAWCWLAVVCCGIWYVTRLVHAPVVHEPTLEIVAYSSYLAGLLTGLVAAVDGRIMGGGV